MQWAFFQIIKRYHLPNNRKWLQMELNWNNSLCQEILVSLIPAFLDTPTMWLAFSQSQFSLCHVSKWPSHLTRLTINQLSFSAPQFQTSLRKKKPTGQYGLLQWGYTNPMSQRTLSLIQSAVARRGAGLCQAKELRKFPVENVWLKFEKKNDVSV